MEDTLKIVTGGIKVEMKVVKAKGGNPWVKANNAYLKANNYFSRNK